MDTRFPAQRLDCLPRLCLETRSENGFVPVKIIFGYRRGFGSVRPARMEFLVGTGSILHASVAISVRIELASGRMTDDSGVDGDKRVHQIGMRPVKSELYLLDLSQTMS